MDVINCPSCENPVEINIFKAIDELGEIYRCPKCGKDFIYARQ